MQELHTMMLFAYHRRFGMNKLAFCAILIVFLLWAVSGFGVNFWLAVTDVQPTMVSGTLRINNVSDSIVTWRFPSSGQFEIWVDDEPSSVTYLDVPSALTVPAHSYIVVDVFHHRDTPLTLGMHYAHARFVTEGYPVAGYQTNFLYGTPIHGLQYVDFLFEITSIGSSSVSGLFTFINNNDAPWQYGFNCTSIGYIRVDGASPELFWDCMARTLTINPWDSYTIDVLYYRTTPFTPGSHVAQVYLMTDNYPAAGEQITFYVAPTAGDDPLMSNSSPLQVSYGPNPFHDYVKMSFSDKAPVSLAIFNQKGQVVKNVIATDTYTWDGLSNNGESCAKGIYYLKAKQGKNSVVRKIIRM
jgi:hypothetical protein